VTEQPPAPADAPPVQRPAAGEDRRSLPAAVAWGGAIAALVVALGAGVVVWRTSDDPSDRTGAPEFVQGWPAAGASRTVTEVAPDGVLEVTQRIHTTEPIGDLDLLLPEAPQASPVAVSDITVTADGRPGSGPSTLTFTRASYVFADATRILVRYRLSGAVELSASAAGRGLATTTALEVSAPQERDTRVVRAHAVLSLACARRVGVAAVPCGEEIDDRQWQVELTGDEVSTRVLAAVTVS